ncbi:uncharacterized protein E5676_scaffold306G001610 [Cucumis melo var. makuwa]|uniref:Uncharacterized protein n=1 Tax=Cucumis melo var. makuwa TaxID=1194695 RepID=A0A5A7TF51_CUCMM|nr:uncharacterized protein E6C27_scaffold67G003720 [Cucumis melo var. makuwa]TYK17885.1 uncharacterized protein E5676_scaffold306G001610 [Cucumis melo var. makuwa]
MGPSLNATSYSGCIVGGVRFHTIERDSRCTTQGSKVMVVDENSGSGSSNNNFYGVLDKVLFVQYPMGQRDDYSSVDDLNFHRPRSDKPISPHVVLFSNTIGVLMQDTFPVCFLMWADVTSSTSRSNQGQTSLLERSNLIIKVASPSCSNNDNMSLLNDKVSQWISKLKTFAVKSNAGTPVPTHPNSQPLSGHEIRGTILGRRSAYLKCLGWGSKLRSRKTASSSSSLSYEQEMHTREVGSQWEYGVRGD